MTIGNDSPKLMMNRKEAAKSLNISVPTLMKLVNREKNQHPIPTVNTGGNKGRILIPFDALEKWVEEETELQMKRKA